MKGRHGFSEALPTGRSVRMRMGNTRVSGTEVAHRWPLNVRVGHKLDDRASAQTGMGQ